MQRNDQQAIYNLLSMKEKASVYEVVGRMEMLLSLMRSNQKLKGSVPFLETYYIVTKDVAKHHLQNKGYFRDFAAMQKLDAYFASLYFEPLRTLLKAKMRAAPWQTFYGYTSQKEGIPFLQMMLGINAHINADLCMTLADINYQNRHDFLAINNILEECIPEVMSFLAFDEHDALGAAGVVFKRIVRDEFKRIVVRWRLNAWNNSGVILADLKNKEKYKKKIHQQTEQVGKDLIRLFDDLQHMRKTSTLLKRLHALKVSI